MRRALLFGATFLAVFPLLTVLYLGFHRGYVRTVLWLANPALEYMDPPLVAVADPSGGWSAYALINGQRVGPVLSMDESGTHLAYIGAALLPALLLATPVSPMQRLRGLAWGAAALLVLHAVTTVGLLGTHECSRSQPARFLCLWMRVQFQASGQWLPIALWVLLSWRHWLDAARAQPPLARPAR